MSESVPHREAYLAALEHRGVVKTQSEKKVCATAMASTQTIIINIIDLEKWGGGNEYSWYSTVLLFYLY